MIPEAQEPGYWHRQRTYRTVEGIERDLNETLKGCTGAGREENLSILFHAVGRHGLYWRRVWRRRSRCLDKRARRRARQQGEPGKAAFVGKKSVRNYWLASWRYWMYEVALYAMDDARRRAEAGGKDGYLPGVRAYFRAMRLQADVAAAVAGPRDIPEFLREGVGATMTGYLRGGISLAANPRLRAVLSEEGLPAQEVLAREIPGAVFFQWDETQAENTRPILQRVVRMLEKAGHQQRLFAKTGKLAPGYEAGGDDPELAEFERQEILREVARQLDSLERAARLSPQQRMVFQMLREGKEPAAIAAWLGISKDHVAVVKHHAIRRVRKAAGL